MTAKQKTLFDYLNSINTSTQDVMIDEDESDIRRTYSAFVINRYLSYFSDTILASNQMNVRPNIPREVHYRFLLNTIRKRKRFSKWLKREDNDDLDVLREYYGYSYRKAVDAMRLLSSEQIQIIRERMDKGGKGTNIR